MKNRVAAVTLFVVALAMAPTLDRATWAGDEVADELMALEKGIWSAWTKGDFPVFEKYLHENSVSLTGAALTSGRANIISAYKEAGCDVRSFQLQDMKAHHINEVTVVLTYRAQQDATCGGEKLDPKLLATSVWVHDVGQWQVASYQETPVAD